MWTKGLGLNYSGDTWFNNVPQVLTADLLGAFPMLPHPALLPVSGHLFGGSARNPLWPGEKPFSCLSLSQAGGLDTQHLGRRTGQPLRSSLANPRNAKGAYDPAIPLSGIYATEMKPCSPWEDSDMNVQATSLARDPGWGDANVLQQVKTDTNHVHPHHGTLLSQDKGVTTDTCNSMKGSRGD